MNPHPGTPPPERCTVDLAPIEPRQAVTVRWRGQPVVVRHRTREEIERARSTPFAALHDRYARNAALPAKTLAHDENRRLAEHPEWLVVIGLCTHMGCILTLSEPSVRHSEDEGWFCRCHAARFDLAGRVIGGPASTLPARAAVSLCRARQDRDRLRAELEPTSVRLIKVPGAWLRRGATEVVSCHVYADRRDQFALRADAKLWRRVKGTICQPAGPVSAPLDTRHLGASRRPEW